MTQSYSNRYRGEPWSADGHNHWLEPTLVDGDVQTHLRDGIFYVKDHGTAAQFHDTMRRLLDEPSVIGAVRVGGSFRA